MSKTETQSEALELAEFFGSMKKSSHRWYDGVPVHEKAAAELRRLDTENKQLNVALDEWMEKTHWVQDTAQVLELGMHRADMLRARIEALDAENKALRARLDAAPAGVAVSAYAVGAVRIERVAQSRGDFKWAVREFGDVLNLDGEWESEPSPSARDDAFLLRCRFDTAQQAIDACIAAQAAAKTGDAA